MDNTQLKSNSKSNGNSARPVTDDAVMERDVDRMIRDQCLEENMSKSVSKEKPHVRNLNVSQSYTRSALFFVIRRVNGDFNKVSPFLIERVLSSKVGNVRSVRKIRDGLLVEVANSSQAEKVMHLSRFDNFDVQVNPHDTLNTSKGVISCRDLLNCSVDEIAEELRTQNVINVRRITTMRDGMRVNTASCILTFNTCNLPDKIKAGFYSLPVRPYIPSPMRCFNCQKFGHSAQRCSFSRICVCGLPLHTGTECIKPLTCPNCKGEHSARSKDCPIYKREAAIQRVKTIDKCSYAEARRKVVGSVSHQSAVSYAEVSKQVKVNDTTANHIVNAILPV